MNQNHSSSSVAIDKISAHFSAAHFLISDHYEEGLHGHNYLVGIKVKGSMDIFDVIIDFVFLENLLSEVLLEWDHFVLIPSKNKHVKIHENKDNLEINYRKRFYSIPKEEVKILDCTNVTTETLARLLGEKLRTRLKKEIFWGRIQAITATIWETSYYRANYTIKASSLEN